MSTPKVLPPLATKEAVIMAAKAITDSIDKSMWPPINTSDKPTERIPTKVAWRRMLMKMPI